MKIKDFINSHKIFLFIVVFIYIYEFIVVAHCYSFIVDDVLYAYYAVDFSMGFCTKILPGAIYNKLIGIYSYKAVSIYVNFLYFIFICIIAILIEKFIKSVPKEYSSECLFMVFLFLTGPFFSAFWVEFGMLDFYWALFFALSIIFLRSRYIKWLVLPMVFLTILVHYSSVVCYVAGLLLIILFMAVNEKNKRQRVELISLFSSSLVVSILETLYFLRYEYDNLVYDVDKFNDILVNERNVKYLEYYDFVFYRQVISDDLPVSSLNQIDVSSFSGFIKNIIYQIEVTLKMSRFEEFWFVYIIGAVLLAFLLYVMISYIKKTDSTGKKLVVSLMIILYFCIVFIGLFFSTDITRWLAHAFIIQFTFVLFVIKIDYKEFFTKLKTMFEKMYWQCIVYGLIHAFTIELIYC